MAFMIIGCNVILFTWKIIKTNYSSYCCCAQGYEGILIRVVGWVDNKSANLKTARICWRIIYDQTAVDIIFILVLKFKTRNICPLHRLNWLYIRGISKFNENF